MAEKYSSNIGGVDFTSAAFINRPRLLFAATNEINKTIRNPEEHVGVELYPFLRRFVLGDMLNSMTFGKLPLPIGITEDKIRGWQKDFPLAKIKRIHVEFCYDEKEQDHRIWIGEKENGKKHQFYQIIWKLFFGPAISMRGIDLAHALADQKVGVNAHMNVWAGFEKAGKIGEIKQRVASTLGENERRYDVEKRLLSDREYIYQPIRVAEMVEKLTLDGMTFGIDHAFDEGLNIEELLISEEVQRNTRVIHLAKSNHLLITPKDEQVNKLLQQIKETKFDKGPIRIAFNFSPGALKGLNNQQIVEKMTKLREWALAA